MDEETEYMKKGWDNNVKNCSINVERAVIVSDDLFDHAWKIFEAGKIIGNLGFEEKSTMHHCGKWYWLEFNETEDAMAFKLKWD